MVGPRTVVRSLLTLAPVVFYVGGADAQVSAPATFTGVSFLDTASWGETPYKTMGAVSDDWNRHSTGSMAVTDPPLPVDQPVHFRMQGKGGKCRLTISVGGLYRPLGVPTWNITADKFPYDYVSTNPVFFFPQWAWSATYGTSGYLVLPVSVNIAQRQPRGANCGPSGMLWTADLTFLGTGHSKTLLQSVQSHPLQLWNVGPGSSARGEDFELTATTYGAQTGSVEMTLSGAKYPNAAHSGKATVTLTTPHAIPNTISYSATIKGNTGAFADLPKLAPGRYHFTATFKGTGDLVGTTAPTAMEVVVGQPPKNAGATVTSIAPLAPGFFVGAPQEVLVSGSPGEVGMCDAYKVQFTPIGGGAGQAVRFTNKAFPQTLKSGTDFTALGAGMWDAVVTGTGALCRGTGDGLVEVDPSPGAFTDRPALAISSGLGMPPVLMITLPPSYGSLPNAGSIACCDTDYYVQSASGVWTSAGGVTTQDYGVPDDQPDGSQLYLGNVPQQIAGGTFAVRVRATIGGQRYAWSNGAFGP